MCALSYFTLAQPSALSSALSGAKCTILLVKLIQLVSVIFVLTKKSAGTHFKENGSLWSMKKINRLWVLSYFTLAEEYAKLLPFWSKPSYSDLVSNENQSGAGRPKAALPAVCCLPMSLRRRSMFRACPIWSRLRNFSRQIDPVVNFVLTINTIEFFSNAYSLIGLWTFPLPYAASAP